MTDIKNINEAYDKLLEAANMPTDENDGKLTDKNVNDLVKAMEKVKKDNKILQAIADLPSNNNVLINNNSIKLDTTVEKATVNINPISGEKAILGIPEEKQEDDLIADSFDELWDKAANSTERIEDIEISDDELTKLAKEQFNLDFANMQSFLALIKEYRQNPEMKGLYSKLPPAIKRIVDAGAIESGVTAGANLKNLNAARNNVSKLILDSFISDITMTKATEEFSSEMNKLFSEAGNQIGTFYYDALDSRLNQLEQLYTDLESSEDNSEEAKQKMVSISEVRDAMIDGITLKSLNESILKIKIRNIDLEKPEKVMRDFDAKYMNSTYNIHSSTLLFPRLRKLYSPEEITSETLTRFILAFCKYTSNMKPANMADHAYMYTVVSNIIFANSESSHTTTEDSFIDNLKECLLKIQNR